MKITNFDQGNGSPPTIFNLPMGTLFHVRMHPGVLFMRIVDLGSKGRAVSLGRPSPIRKLEGSWELQTRPGVTFSFGDVLTATDSFGILKIKDD